MLNKLCTLTIFHISFSRSFFFFSSVLVAGIVVIVAVVIITFLLVSIAVVSVMRWRLSKMRVIVDMSSVRMNELEETIQDGKEVRLCVCVCACVWQTKDSSLNAVYICTM